MPTTNWKVDVEEHHQDLTDNTIIKIRLLRQHEDWLEKKGQALVIPMRLRPDTEKLTEYILSWIPELAENGYHISEWGTYPAKHVYEWPSE